MAYSEELIKELKEKGQLLRRDCIKCIGVGVAGHVGGSCSSADLVAALYFHKMKYDPKNTEWEGRDYFLLSKGHVAILQYSALAEAAHDAGRDASLRDEDVQGHADHRHHHRAHRRDRLPRRAQPPPYAENDVHERSRERYQKSLPSGLVDQELRIIAYNGFTVFVDV